MQIVIKAWIFLQSICIPYRLFSDMEPSWIWPVTTLRGQWSWTSETYHLPLNVAKYRNIITNKPNQNCFYVVLLRFSVLLMIYYYMCHHGRRKRRVGGAWSPIEKFLKNPPVLPPGKNPSDAHECHALNQWWIWCSGSLSSARVLDFVQ